MLAARRVVVKIGSSSLTGPDGLLDPSRVRALVDAVAARVADGCHVVIVSSGAIAAGLGPLGLAKRPKDLGTLQAAASVGQGLLVAAYAGAAARHQLTVAQVLLTADDVARRVGYRNARTTLNRLLELGVVPVVNENDAVATEEIRFGDNDRLAALVAHLVEADLLVLLSDVDALYDRPPSSPGAVRVDVVAAGELVDVEIGGSFSTVGTGGMATKIDAARIAAGAGVTTVLTSAAQVVPALAGTSVGTLFEAATTRLQSRRLWLAHATAPRGTLHLDAGAVRALVTKGASLLAAGVSTVDGDFAAGDAVLMVDPAGVAVARGLVGYPAEVLRGMLGRSTPELVARLGPAFEREVVHRDDLALL